MPTLAVGVTAMHPGKQDGAVMPCAVVAEVLCDLVLTVGKLGLGGPPHEGDDEAAVVPGVEVARVLV